jgi:hypothetical protein
MEYQNLILEESTHIFPFKSFSTRDEAIALDTITSEMMLYQFLAQSKDVKAFLKRIHTLVHRAGFSDFCHMLIERADDVREQVGTYPEVNREMYIAEEHYKYDLMLQHSLLSDRPIYQSEINLFVDNAPVENRLFERNKAIYKLMQSVGMHDYYNIPFQSYSGHGKAIFSVTSEGEGAVDYRRKVERCKTGLHILAKAIDHVGSQKFSTHFPTLKAPQERVINAKPLQLLSTLANHNVTLNEAANMLHISISTANQQIAAAKKALGANTTAGAIVQALKLGLIVIDSR